MEDCPETEMKRSAERKVKTPERADEFILFAGFRAFGALRKKFSLGFLFLLGQSKRKAKKNSVLHNPPEN
jgi:hypothetical protein